MPYSKAGRTLSGRAGSIPQDCQHASSSMHVIPGMHICDACGVELHAKPEYCSHVAVNEETMVCHDCCTRPKFRPLPHCDHNEPAYCVLLMKLYCMDCGYYLRHDSIPREKLSQLQKDAYVQRQARLGRPPSIREQDVKAYLMACWDRSDHEHRERSAAYLHGRLANWIDDPIPLPKPEGAKKTDPAKVSAACLLHVV